MSLGYAAVSFWRPLDECVPKHWYSRLRCDFKKVLKVMTTFPAKCKRSTWNSEAGTAQTAAPTKEELKNKQCISRNKDVYVEIIMCVVR